MTWRASILTLYPEMFPGPLGQSLAGRALAEGTWSLDTVQIRDFATDKHRSVDDTPAGGGAGMVMRADVLARAVDHVLERRPDVPMLAMTPRGRRSEEHTSELQSLMRISYAVFCLKKKNKDKKTAVRAV